MPRWFLHCLCLGALLSCNLVKCTIFDDEEPRRTYPARRAIDGSRGRKFYVAEDLNDGGFDAFGSSAGQYDPYEEETDFSDIRNNIPGEPGVDYPSYTRLPQTGFICENHFRGYYADEAAGCQVFHVCDGTFLVSSFLCPVGSIFSQKLLTCDWWSKVDCSSTRNYHAINIESHVSEADDDDILRKAFEMSSVQSAGERIPVDTITEQRRQDDRRNRVSNFVSTQGNHQRGINDLQTGPDNYSDYPDYTSRGVAPRHRTSGEQSPNRQRYQEEDYYSQVVEDERPRHDDNPAIRIHTIGEDRNNDRKVSFRNEFKPSYAPTVPTVTTTARSFYSPTIPTAFRSSTTARDSSRYDLEVESSDHLYTARGRSDETIKAATPPSVIVKNVIATRNISLPMMINGASENDEERIDESESSEPKTVTFLQVVTNATRIEANTEKIIAIDDAVSENTTETLTILTIDNENRDPAVFSYSRDDAEEKNAKEISSKPTSRINSTEDSNLSASEEKEPATFLQPPRLEGSNEFRIMVLEESSSTEPGSAENYSRQDKSLKKNSTSSFSASIRVPESHITPPFFDKEKERRESRIIRIFVNKNETAGNNSSESIVTRASTEKPETTDRKAVSGRGNDSQVKKNVEDSVDHAEEAEIIRESVPTSTSIPSRDAKPNTKSDNPRSIDINNLAVLVAASEGSIINGTKSSSVVETSTISEEKEADDGELLSRSGESSTKGQEIADSVNEASSPYQVTLTVDKDEELDPNGDVIRKLIAQQEVGDSTSAADYKSFEIIKSRTPEAMNEEPEEPIASTDAATQLKNDRRVSAEREGKKLEEKSHNFRTNDLQSMDYYRDIVALVNGPNAPRPFSLGKQQTVHNVEIKTPSDLIDRAASTSSPFVPATSANEIVTISTGAPHQTTQKSFSSSTQQPRFSEESVSSIEEQRNEDATEKSSQTFGERKVNGKKKIIFELPHSQRTLDFQTGLPLHDGPKIIEDENVEDLVTEKATEKFYAKTVVETEVIPSLGFSLNTEEEREEYMEAVMKGLLHDVQATESTENVTETIAES